MMNFKWAFSSLVFFLISFNILATSFLPFDQTDKNNTKEMLTEKDQDYFTISSIAVTPLKNKQHPAIGTPFALNQEEKEIIFDLKKMVVMGKKIWNVITNGRPVIDLEMVNQFSVLPKLADNEIAEVFDLENWTAPMIKSYGVSVKNFLGMEVVTFVYHVMYQYNGQLNGKGKYMNGVTILAKDVKVAWGYTFNAKSTLIAISNTGSVLDPVAAATVKMSLSITNILKDTYSERAMFISGNGSVLEY